VKKAFSLLILLIIGSAVAAEAGEAILGPSAFGPFSVGYRVQCLQDAARSFGDGRTRPVTLHLWYPVARPEGKPMEYKEYVWAARGGAQGREERRRDVLAAYKSVPVEMGADEIVLDNYLDRATQAHFDSPPGPGRFPLILYAPSLNADPFENAELFEMLASHGYVKAAASCLGWENANSERNSRGALAQWGDLGFLLNQLWRETFVDPDHIGLIGFSWGGMTGLQFALSRPGIEAVADLDGAQGMAAYRAVAESFPLWSPRRLRSPVFYILPEGEERDAGFFSQTLYADTYIWKMPAISHRDFSSDLIINRRRAAGDPKTAETERIYSEIAAKLKIFFDWHLKKIPSSRADWMASPKQEAGWSMRPALPAPPSPALFIEIIEKQGEDRAVALFRDLRRADPGLLLLDEPRLLEFGALWGPERSEDLFKLLTINLEMYPRSADTHFWLAQVYLARKDKSAALRSLEAALAIDPNHAKALRLKKKI